MLGAIDAAGSCSRLEMPDDGHLAQAAGPGAAVTERSPRRRRPRSPFAAGLVSLFVIVIAVYFGFTKAIPFQHHFTIHAAFKTANNIKKGSPVRIAGVNVGKVTGVHFLGQGQSAAVVDMRIDDTGLPIHTDATVKVRPRIFLEGNFFMDLSPGSPSAPAIRDGGMIPVTQTSAPVQLDQVLSVLQTSTRSDLQTLLHELSVGFGGEGGLGFNRSLQYQGTADRTGAIVSDATLGTAEHDLSNYIKGAGATAAALDRWGRIDGLVNNAGTTKFAPMRKLDALDAADFQRIYAVNTIGAYQMVRACEAPLRTARGAVVNVSSISSTMGPGVNIDTTPYR